MDAHGGLVTRAAERRLSNDAYAAYIAEIHLGLLRSPTTPAFVEVDGTLVFADVSGFTPLTEKLARRGKIGAEELTDVLNDVFAVLLDRAADHGGDLLKFGGDALLLFFSGPGHASRGAAAALAMQEGLRPFHSFMTESGRVSLRMSVGVNSGSVLFVLVGSSHRELLVCGPVMSRLVELESAADAGEVLVGTDTAALLDRRWLAREKDGGTLLRRTIRVAPVPVVMATGDRGPTRTPLRAVEGVPVGLRDHLATHHGGEHRLAVLTFIQFKGVDGLLDRSGPEAVAGALHDLVCATQSAAERHGVTFLATDLDKDGGKILLSAGAPTSSEADVDRTFAAVLDVLADAPAELTVRAGVNRGRAFAVDIGSESRRTYAVMGDATNLAARVMGKASPGELCATAAATDSARSGFDLTRLEPFMVKGKSTPISASIVRGATATAVTTDDELPLVGRVAERAALRRVLERASQGAFGAAEIVAEAGMGKSRLVAEALDDAPGEWSVVRVDGAPYAASSPYLAVRDPIRKVLGQAVAASDDEALLRAAIQKHRPELAPLMPVLGRVFGLELEETDESSAIDAEFRRTTLHNAMSELIVACVAAPVAFVVEDAHWLDEASGDLLSVLMSSGSLSGWAVLATRRDQPAPLRLPPTAARIALTPLDAPSVDALLVSGLGERLPPITRRAVAERSGGNPLFAKELVHAIHRGESLDALPETVEALIAARIDTLPRADRDLLRQASVLGAQFSTSLLAAVSDEPPSDVAARVAALDSFVEPGSAEGTFRFQHALVREAAYEGLPFRVRRELHARSGAIIERTHADELDEWSDLLSLHFTAAGDAAKSFRYSVHAGDRARRTFAATDAVAFYRRAADAARRLPVVSTDQIASLYENLGDCAEMSGQYQIAVDAFARARKARASQPVRLAELQRKEGWVRERSGRYADALRWYTRARRVLGDAGEAEADSARRLDAKLLLAAGVARLRQGRYRQCVPLLEEAARKAQSLGDLATLAHAYDSLDWAHTDLGSAEAHRYRELSLPIYEELGDLNRQGIVSTNLGIDAYFEGRWDDAVAWYQRGRALSERAGNAVQAAMAANNLGELESDRGHLDVAQALFRDALLVWEAAPFPVGVAVATSNLGRAAVRIGELEEARRLLADARAHFEEIGAAGYVVETDVRELERLVMHRRPLDALALVSEVTDRAKAAGGMPLVMLTCDRMAAVAEAQLGHTEAALAMLLDVERRANRLHAIYELAVTAEISARIQGAETGPDARQLLADLGIAANPVFPLH